MIDIINYTAPDGLLDDRVILITGATEGIGRALARRCASLGATVVLLGRRIERLETLHDEIVTAGHPQPAIYPFNLETTEWSEYEKMAGIIREEFGRLDGIVNNGGMLGELSPIEHYDPYLWFRVMQVNLNSAFLITRACLPLLRLSTDPSILFVTSSVGESGRAHWGAYAVSKFGVEGLAQVLADELENSGARVNLINPGSTRTDMRRSAYPMEDHTDLARPDDVLPAYLYFLGPDAKGVSGLRIDCQPKPDVPDAQR